MSIFKAKRIFAPVIAAIMLFALFAGCARPAGGPEGVAPFASYRDIPGVTAEEISAVEELRGGAGSFVYAMTFSTEAFYGEDGDVGGFSALFAEWLSELFDIPFEPRIVKWEELIEGLESGAIDFTGDLTGNEERRSKYFMTDDIAQRQVVYIRADNHVSLDEIADVRPLKFAFLDGATTVDDVRRYEGREFLEFFVDDYAEAYEMLATGEIDAFFDESPVEAAFDFFGEVASGVFFPIIYSPVALATQNPDNRPIIDIVQKALENGAIHHLTRLYNEGHRDYLRHKLSMLLTEEEQDFIANNPVIAFAAETANYPISFYDTRLGRFEGIAHDVIAEMERLTGLTFEQINGKEANWPELLEKLESGQASMVTELIPSEERIGNFLWPGEAFFRDYFVLVSKSDFHEITVNEILYVRTGVAKNTAHSNLFDRWFPNHRGKYIYESTYAAFDALDRGEVDVVITSEHQLLMLTNYRELVGYKANYIFPFYFDSTFGINRDEEALQSIVTKAMRLIDVDGISGSWLRKTYDYSIRLNQERIPLLAGGGILLIGLIFAVVLFVRKRSEGKKLEKLVELRTKESSEKQLQLHYILLQNELQLLKHDLMVQATKIGLWDMEIVKDDPVNPDNEFIWSDEFRRMLGYTDEKDFPNILSSWSDSLHPDDKGVALEALSNHLLDTTGETPYDLEYRLRKKDGEYAYFRASGETIRDDEGNAVRVAGALLDISETKKLMHDLERKRKEAETANEAKTAFLANMSHEIRTPMNAILGMSEILEHERLNARQMRFVQDISNSAYSLLGIINDILDMSKIESGKLELHPEDYNFNQFMDNIISMFSHVARNKGLDFVCEIEDGVPDYLYGDDLRLRQVLTNICGNATKFTDEGGVTLSVRTAGDMLEFRIEDTGPGIQEEDMPKLFNAFEQVDKSRNKHVMGTGLGLPICKSFIEMMDGEINVESEIGKGSTFKVSIPIVEGDPDNVHNLENLDEEQTISAPDAKVLVVDDNEFNLKVASGLLSLMDIDAETVDSGIGAIESVKKKEYDIVFMDHMMPGKDGIETVREIRELGGKFKKLTIIALTANAVKGAREMFLKNGFDDFIAKPINTEELREIVKKYLPPEKVMIVSSPAGGHARMGREEELFTRAAVIFVKDNQKTFENITESLRAGDTKTAHRIAHTLKSSAGYLDRMGLQKAAFSLEQSLGGETPEYTREQLDKLEKELIAALGAFEPLLAAAESGKPDAVRISDEEMAELLAEVRPLVEKGDFGATDYVERLRGVEGAEELATRIEDYDFEGALKALDFLEL